MHFHYYKVQTLPRLSWAAIVEKGNENVKVFHGPWLEIGDDFFVDGAWDSDFENADFDQSHSFMGFGAKAGREGVTFCCPCHPLERLNLFRTSDKIFVSPSLAFLLKLCDRDLDSSYAYYSSDFLSFVRRIDNHVGSIPINGGKVEVVHYRNVEIDKELNTKILKKNTPHEFTDFASYKAFISSTFSSILLNAGSAKRRVKYTTPVATMSSGYDSAACAAIAKDHGCEEAVTYRLSPEDQLLFVGGNDDCGTAIAEKLGLRVRETDPKDYLKFDNVPEAEFVATGYGDEALSMSVFEADFSQRLVITGVHGGMVWSRIPRTKLVNGIYMGDGCGCSLAEFRYRVGFIHVPLPFIGSFNYPSISRITLSEEMKSYSIGGNYDRPIPRRILEEKGVDRGLFGQKKAGLLPGLLGSNKTELQRRMTKKSFMSFEEYYQQNRSKRCFLSTVVHMSLFAFYKYYSRLLFRVSRRKDMITILGCPIPGKFRNSPLRRNFLFNWGISVVQNRYDLLR